MYFGGAPCTGVERSMITFGPPWQLRADESGRQAWWRALLQAWSTWAWVSPLAPERSAPARLAWVRLAPVKSAPVKTAAVRLAPTRLALRNEARSKWPSSRLAPSIEAPLKQRVVAR